MKPIKAYQYLTQDTIWIDPRTLSNPYRFGANPTFGQYRTMFVARMTDEERGDAAWWLREHAYTLHVAYVLGALEAGRPLAGAQPDPRDWIATTALWRALVAPQPGSVLRLDDGRCPQCRHEAEHLLEGGCVAKLWPVLQSCGCTYDARAEGEKKRKAEEQPTNDELHRPDFVAVAGVACTHGGDCRRHPNANGLHDFAS